MNIRRSWFVLLALAIVVLAAAQDRGVTTGQAELCGGTVEIANGGFESPVVPPYFGQPAVPDAWSGIGQIFIFGSNSGDPTQYVRLGSSIGPGSISQGLSQLDLPGSTITFTIRAMYPGTVELNGEIKPFAGPRTDWVTTDVTFDIPANATLPLMLTLHGALEDPEVGTSLAQVESIVGTYAKPCPTQTPTQTMTPSPTATQTMTPSPTITPSPTTEPTATTVPLADVQMTVTGDPRFPLSGSAAIPGEPGLTYTVGTPPNQGNVVLTPDGGFTYTANSYLVTSDVFTIVASDGVGDTALITVTVLLEIDPSVPTYGTVKPGGTGNGGSVTDPRSPGSRTPTPVPDDNDDGGDCIRCD